MTQSERSDNRDEICPIDLSNLAPASTTHPTRPLSDNSSQLHRISYFKRSLEIDLRLEIALSALATQGVSKLKRRLLIKRLIDGRILTVTIRPTLHARLRKDLFIIETSLPTRNDFIFKIKVD